MKGTTKHCRGKISTKYERGNPPHWRPSLWDAFAILLRWDWNFTAHVISNSRKYDHISPILKDLKWLPVKQQLYYRHTIVAFKCMSGCTPASLFSKYIQRAMITRRTTRNSQMLNIPLYKTATGQRTFYFKTVKLWNSLDSTLKLKPTLQDFKHCLKRSLISNFLVT